MRLRPKSLQEIFILLAWLNWVVGLGIIEIPYGHPRQMFSVIYCGTCATMYYYVCKKFLTTETFWYEADMIIYIVILSILLSFDTLSIFLAWQNQKIFRTIVTKCIKVDDILEDLGLEKNYTSLFHKLLIYIIVYFSMQFLASLLSVIEVVQGTSSIRSVAVLIVFNVPVFINIVVNITFIFLVKVLNIQFRRSNELIRKICVCNTNWKGFRRTQRTSIEIESTFITILRHRPTNTYSNQRVLGIMRLVHLELYRISRLVNSLFCQQLLLEYLLSFSLISLAIYNIYIIFVIPHRTHIDKQEMVLTMIMWCVIHAFKIIAVNYTCSELSTEYEKTGWMLQNCERFPFNEDAKEEIQQFSLQMLANPLHFNAWGFFFLDNKTTGKFFSAVITYLIIFIQFSNSPTALKALNELLSN